MRLILSLLTVANLRWARAALVRSERLYDEGDEAFRESERHLAIADGLARRAHARA